MRKVNDRPSYAQDLLKKGLPLGFIGGTDSHASLTFGRGAVEHLDSLPGLTALKAGKLNRENIVDALKNRQCYAVSKDRILVQATINGEPFGQKIKRNGSPRIIEAMIAGKAELERIDIVRNGDVVYTVEPDGWHTTIAFTDSDDLDGLTFESPFIGDFVYYYIRVTCRNNTQAWTSPAWFV